jgi:outer membrane immunogenic protein
MNCHLESGMTDMQSVLRATAILALLVGTPFVAKAADLPAPAPIRAPAAYVPPPPPFSWTGFYVGGNLGAGWSSGNITDTLTGLNFSGTSNATFVGGGQFGGNYQIGAFVIGGEADFDWLSNNNNSGPGVTIPAGPLGGTTLRVSVNNRWETTLAVRAGWAINTVLLYAKGGGGWVGAGNFAITNVGTGGTLTVSNSNTNSGWLAGGGVEWAFLPNWTVRAEYDFLGLGNKSYTAVIPGTPFADTFSTNNRSLQTFTVGVNYLFNWGP